MVSAGAAGGLGEALAWDAAGAAGEAGGTAAEGGAGAAPLLSAEEQAALKEAAFEEELRKVRRLAGGALQLGNRFLPQCDRC